MTSSLLHQVTQWSLVIALLGLTLAAGRAIVSKQFSVWQKLSLVVSWLAVACALVIVLLGW